MTTPNIPLGALGAFSEEQERRKQEEEVQQRRQPPAQQAPPAAQPPPTAAPSSAVNADAALFAVQSLSEQNLTNQSKRDLEAQSVEQLTQEADRFEQNAATASQAAQESAGLAQENRAQAEQLTQVHAQEAEAEAQQLAAAEDQAFTAEIQRVTEDPEAMAQIVPELGIAIGLKADAIGPKEITNYQDVETVFLGQLDRNNAKQVALQEKIIKGEGFSTGEKITLAIAAMLPIIIGASRGNLGAGLAAAGQSINNMLALRQTAQTGREEELAALEAKEAGLIGQREDILLTQARRAATEVGTGIATDKDLRAAFSQELKDRGIAIELQGKLEDVKKKRVQTKAERISFAQKLKDFASGKLGRTKSNENQKKAAGFSVRMTQSQELLADLMEGGFKPIELEGSLPNRSLSGDRQVFDFAVRNFINAILRLESGAAISPAEFVSARLQYIPQPGDGAAVLTQKRLNRAISTASLAAAAGEDAVNDVYKELAKLAPNAKIIPADFSAPPADDPAAAFFANIEAQRGAAQ